VDEEPVRLSEPASPDDPPPQAAKKRVRKEMIRMRAVLKITFLTSFLARELPPPDLCLD